MFRFILLMAMVSGLIQTALAQPNAAFEAEIRNLYASQNYSEVITYAKHANQLNDSSLYRIGRAYFRQKDHPNALKFFDLALAQNSAYQNAWYFRGVVNRYDKAFPQALSDAEHAISLDSTDADYYFLMGDVLWSMGQLDRARAAFESATRREDCEPATWSYIGRIYAEQKQYEKAVTAFREALPKIAQDTSLYLQSLYNLGMNEYLSKHFEQAENTLKELIAQAPDDYLAYPKLIQALYAQKKYEQAKPLKTILYDAWKAEKLPKRLKDEFCFDQFEWDGKRVMVFERFAEGDDLYYKHIFYVLDQSGKDLFQVQTEYSFAIAMSGKKYTLGMDKDNTHYTFIQYLFGENPDYEDLKAKVLRILDGKAKASSSSTNSKN